MHKIHSYQYETKPHRNDDDDDDDTYVIYGCLCDILHIIFCMYKILCLAHIYALK